MVLGISEFDSSGYGKASSDRLDSKGRLGFTIQRTARMKIVRTYSADRDFIRLVERLDEFLSEVNGDDHSFYNRFNSLDDIKHVVVAYEDGLAVSCGAFKRFDALSCEIKRMFTEPTHRGRGAAGRVLDELERWAKELGYASAVLETSVKLDDARRLYERKGYSRIDNYGQYRDAADSICFMKTL